MRYTVVSVVLLCVTVLSCWLWWEVHKFTMDWSRHRALFPLPFWIAELPAYFLVDLSIALIVAASLTETLIIAYLDRKTSGGRR